MEHSSLNLAHQYLRCAEAHLRSKRFDEAIEYHCKAAQSLEDAFSLTNNAKSLESLRLQRDFLLRQKRIILVKKEQYDNFKKADEKQRLRLQNACIANDYEDNQKNKSTTLQVAIYRAIDHHDSLLARFVSRGPANSDSESTNNDADERFVSLDSTDGTTLTVDGTKLPKPDKMIIEELQTLSQQLHSLVYELVTQLDSKSREVEVLKERIQQLEGDRARVCHKHDSGNSLKIKTDSSEGTSPYVFTPCSELSPDIPECRTFPTLAPLEFPNFNFTLGNSNFSLNNGN